MNDFLEQIWLDNPVKSYLIVLGIILFVLFLKRIISRYFASLMFRVLKNVWKNDDHKAFVDLIVQPLGFFLIVLVSIAAIDKLSFPHQLNVAVYGYSIQQILHSLASMVLIFSFIWLLLRSIDFIAMILERKADLTPDQSDNQFILFFKNFFKAILVIIGILMVLNMAFGVDVRNFLTGLSIVGAAIALALRESIENLIASFIIFFDKPFTTGDLVKVLNVTGNVERIGLRSTRIRTEQKTFVTVPNKQMVDTVLDNLSLQTQRKAELKLEINLNVPSGKIQQFIDGIKNIVTKKEIQESNVYMPDITGQFFHIQADYFTAPVTFKEFNAIRQDVNIKVLKLMEELGIEIAGANTDVRVNSKPS